MTGVSVQRWNTCPVLAGCFLIAGAVVPNLAQTSGNTDSVFVFTRSWVSTAGFGAFPFSERALRISQLPDSSFLIAGANGGNFNVLHITREGTPLHHYFLRMTSGQANPSQRFLSPLTFAIAERNSGVVRLLNIQPSTGVDTPWTYQFQHSVTLTSASFFDILNNHRGHLYAIGRVRISGGTYTHFLLVLDSATGTPFRWIYLNRNGGSTGDGSLALLQNGNLALAFRSAQSEISLAVLDSSLTSFQWGYRFTPAEAIPVVAVDPMTNILWLAFSGWEGELRVLRFDGQSGQYLGYSGRTMFTSGDQVINILFVDTLTYVSVQIGNQGGTLIAIFHRTRGDYLGSFRFWDPLNTSIAIFAGELLLTKDSALALPAGWDNSTEKRFVLHVMSMYGETDSLCYLLSGGGIGNPVQEPSISIISTFLLEDSLPMLLVNAPSPAYTAFNQGILQDSIMCSGTYVPERPPAPSSPGDTPTGISRKPYPSPSDIPLIRVSTVRISGSLVQYTIFLLADAKLIIFSPDGRQIFEYTGSRHEQVVIELPTYGLWWLYAWNLDNPAIRQVQLLVAPGGGF